MHFHKDQSHSESKLKWKTTPFVKSAQWAINEKDGQAMVMHAKLQAWNY